MTKRLVNPTVKYISILTDETQPANGKPVIIKGAKYQEIYKATVKSVDDLEGDIYWRAMISGESDTDNETYEKSDVKFAQRNFMKSLQDTEAVSDVNHNMEVQKGVYMVESYLTEVGNEIAWDGVTNVKEHEALFQKAKEGKITGVSIYGWVEDVQDVKSKSESSMIKDLWNKFFGKEENKIEEVDMTVEEIKAMTDEELAELELMRIPAKAETPEEPKGEPEPETQEEPENEQLKSELETLKADLTEKELLLSKAQEQIDALTKEKNMLEKARTTKPNDGAEPEKKALTKSEWSKLDAFDKHNFAVEFPDLAKEYENSL